MKLLLDQNLSPRLVDSLGFLYLGSVHVRSLGLARTSDAEIWDYTAARGFVIVSKDSDFRQLSSLQGAPPKIVWIASGNCSTAQIELLLQDRRQELEDFEGGKKSGTFVELVRRKAGGEWCQSANSRELNKLCRTGGKQRALVIVDTSKKSPLTINQMKTEYAKWKCTPGNYQRRPVCIIYSKGPEHTFSFGLKIGPTKVEIED